MAKDFEPKKEMDEGQKKNFAKSIMSEKEPEEPKQSGFSCPACGARITVEAEKQEEKK
jgi:hypothetical protein